MSEHGPTTLATTRTNGTFLGRWGCTMLTTLALIVALVAASVEYSNAAKQPNLQSVWAAWVRHAVPQMTEVIRKLHEWRDAACMKLLDESETAACAESYNFIILLTKNELATLEKWLAGLKNEPKFKPSRTEVNSYNRRNRMISNMFGELWKVYRP